METAVTCISAVARVGVTCLWAAQIAYVFCFARQDEEGVEDRRCLRLSSVFYFIILTLCS